MIKRGDFFIVEGTGFISRMIRFRTGGRMSHSGILNNSSGDTTESLMRIEHGHLKKYLGKRIIIFRPIVHHTKLYAAMNWAEKKWLGKIYPWWRMIFHLVGIDGFSIADRPVCSEYITNILHRIELWIDNPWGVNPDDLSDTCLTLPKKFQIVFRGKVHETLYSDIEGDSERVI